MAAVPWRGAISQDLSELTRIGLYRGRTSVVACSVRLPDSKSADRAVIRVSAHWSEIHALNMHILIVLLMMNRI